MKKENKMKLWQEEEQEEIECVRLKWKRKRRQVEIEEMAKKPLEVLKYENGKYIVKSPWRENETWNCIYRNHEFGYVVVSDEDRLREEHVLDNKSYEKATENK